MILSNVKRKYFQTQNCSYTRGEWLILTQGFLFKLFLLSEGDSA